MSRFDWETRMSEIRQALADAGKLSADDPSRNELIAQIRNRMAELRDDESVSGRPGWVRSDRQTREELGDFRRRSRPVLDAIKERIDNDTGRSWNWGKDLWVGSNRELTFVGFDLWYQRDEDLEQDRASGRRAELASIMQGAAREIANADSEVRFHSHQTVQEKCGGDYFRYLR